MSSRGSIIVLSAPSGAGKTTVAREVLRQVDQLIFSVSHTTREARRGECHGENYFFVSEDEFKQMVQEDAFLEFAQVYGNYYGTSRSFVERQVGAGIDVLLDIDVQGAQQVKEKVPDAVLVFLLPPSMEELASRLRNRALDNEKEIARRLEIARKEIHHFKEYDYVIINTDFEHSVLELKSIILAARCSRGKRMQEAHEISKTFGENTE